MLFFLTPFFSNYLHVLITVPILAIVDHVEPGQTPSRNSRRDPLCMQPLLYSKMLRSQFCHSSLITDGCDKVGSERRKQETSHVSAMLSYCRCYSFSILLSPSLKQHSVLLSMKVAYENNA